MAEAYEPSIIDKAVSRRAHKQAMAIVTDWAEACRILEQEATPVALDLETNGLLHADSSIAVVALYGEATNTAAVIHNRATPLDPRFVAWLSEPSRQFITHNGTGFDLGFLADAGVSYRQPTWYDTMIGEQAVLTTGRKDVKVNLKDTLARRLGVTIPKDMDHATWMLPVLDDAQRQYIADDIYYLPKLRQSQLDRAAEQDGKYQREGMPGVRDSLAFEQQLAPIVAGMIMRGLPIDVDALRTYVADQRAALPEHERWLKDTLKLDGFGYAPKVKAAINETYGVDIEDTRADTLKLYLESDGPIAECARRLLALRHGSKRESMYGETFEEAFISAGRLYGVFRQLGTDTGRFSSWKPNLQQLPRDMRHVITDPSGEVAICAADYSAIEAACAAALYPDPALLEAFNSGLDIHRYVASMIFAIPYDEITPEQRRQAKAGVFNLTFGGGFRKLYNKARADGSKASYAEVEAFGRKFLERFQGIASARERAYRTADMRRPVPLTFPTGLRRILVGQDLKGTTLLNNSVQSIAAAGLKHALLLMDEAGISQYLAAVVHDETVLTPPRELADEVSAIQQRCMIEGMQRVTDAPVKVEGKGGLAWG